MPTRCRLSDLYRECRMYMEHHMPCVGELYGPIYPKIQIHHALHLGNVWCDQIYLEALRTSPYLITPTVFNEHIMLKEWFLITLLFYTRIWFLKYFMEIGFRKTTVLSLKCWQRQRMKEKFSAVLMKSVYEK